MELFDDMKDILKKADTDTTTVPYLSHGSIENRDCNSPPGATISDWLDENHYSETWLADKLECCIEYLYDILDGVVKIDDNLASELSIYVGGSKKFWLTREEQYRFQQRKLRFKELLRTRYPNLTEEQIKVIISLYVKKYTWLHYDERNNIVTMANAGDASFIARILWDAQVTYVDH